MVNANQVVNSLGPTFVSQLAAERGAEVADVVRAFRIAREVVGADARWDAVEGLGRDVAARRGDEADDRRRPARRGRRRAGTSPIRAAGGAGGPDRRRRGAVRAARRRAAGDRRGRLARAPRAGRRAARGRGRAARGRLGARALARADAGARRDRRARSARAGRSRTSPAPSTGSPRELDIVWILGALDDLPQPTRTQRWAVQAVREDCLDALAEPGDLRAASARPTTSRRPRPSTPTSSRAPRSRGACTPSRAR